jgi:polysaccharide export outer membrane protein
MVIYINVLDQRTLAAGNLYLYPGDMIIVPPLKARYWRQYVIPETRTAFTLITAAIALFSLIRTFR